MFGQMIEIQREAAKAENKLQKALKIRTPYSSPIRIGTKNINPTLYLSIT